MFFFQEGFTYRNFLLDVITISSSSYGSGCSLLSLPIYSDATTSPAGSRQYG